MNSLPSKIKNLYELQKLGIDVPFFVVVDEIIYKNIKTEIVKIKDEFIKKGIKSIIIRSAGIAEDLQEKSRAGFFESSNEIIVSDLSEEKIKYFWDKNKKKAEQTSSPSICLFIQEFFKADVSGVLFTQTPCDENKSLLLLSAQDRAITEGFLPEEKIFYFRKDGKWEEESKLTNEVKNNLENIIIKSDKNFPEGADLELGIKENVVKTYQIRPITRNNDEKILLKEKKRLENKFGLDFNNQKWGRNGFVYALGDLSPLSLSFYNYLLKSEELKNILEKYKVLDKLEKDSVSDLLENIGGRTYFNFTQEKLIFSQKSGWWNDFKRAVLFLSLENTARKDNEEEKEEGLSLEHCFAWLFLSGIFFQFFLEQEKRKYKKEIFIEKLKNTEIFCNAEEPKPEKLDDAGLEEFISKYYYLSDYPYELSATSLINEHKGKVLEKYKHFIEQKEKSVISQSDILGEKTRYWLKTKIFWKHIFLKKLFEHKKYLIEKYGEEVFQANNWEKIIKNKEKPNKEQQLFTEKISENYSKISGKYYPFPEKGNIVENFIITSGNIDFKNIIFVQNTDQDVNEYLSQFIAVPIFPSDWIPYIPRFKGIVVKEGNELSHMAITCREYNIPCIIKKDIFDEYEKNKNK